MTKKSLLHLTGVGKAYKDWGYEFRRILSWFGLPMVPHQEYWALKNIKLKIYSGESVGIVGQNGAGKSTLLKMIAGVLDQTTGQIEKQGRIGAILELGLGFHPDLSGRENSLHSLALLGFSKFEIRTLIAEVESFAEIGEAFDHPLQIDCRLDLGSSPFSGSLQSPVSQTIPTGTSTGRSCRFLPASL